MPVKIITDSTAYLSDEELSSFDIDRLSLYINDGSASVKEVDLDYFEFYYRLKDMSTIPKSAQPSPEDILESFRRAIAEGREVLAVLISSKMSGTIQSAEMLARQFMSEHPGSRIEILDSRSNSRELGFAALSAAVAAKAGESLDACIEAARNTMMRSRFIFAPKTLEYLTRGGRIGRASALLGSLLKIVPILTVDDEGLTSTFAKVRSFNKALLTMRDKMLEDIELGGGLKNICIHSIAELNLAQEFKRDLIDPVLGMDVDIVNIGPVIGAHVGPAVGLVYETNNPLRSL